MTENNLEFSAEERMKALIETLDSYISQYHGGSVEMVNYYCKCLKVRLGGACLGCPLSPTTINGWVAGTVRQFFPEIEKIESVEDTGA
ncbi:MAG TPA: NifU family protein, partial [Anaerolineaceae bacterium]